MLPERSHHSQRDVEVEEEIEVGMKEKIIFAQKW